MYAIIATGGKQYKVSEGDIITIEKLGKEAGEKVTFDQVLAVSDNGIKVGSDVANASVEASVVKEGRGKKVIVYKYKRKTGYHKKNGHRQAFTQVKIEKINEFLGFECLGHAGYAEEGEDIVCAGISALVINTVNSLGLYTKDAFSTDSDEETGKISLSFSSPAGHDADLLMKSLVLGLQGIQNTYGNDYIILKFREV